MSTNLFTHFFFKDDGIIQSVFFSLQQSTSTSSTLRHELESVTNEANSAMQQASSAETHLMKLTTEKGVMERQLQVSRNHLASHP